MKMILRLVMVISLLLVASNSFAWNGNSNNWGPFGNNGWGNNGWGGNSNNWGPFGNNGWGNNYNPYDEWDPRYWMEEMEDAFDNDGNYGRGWGGAPWGGPPPGYYGAPPPGYYGGSGIYNPDPYGPPPGYYGPGAYGQRPPGQMHQQGQHPGNQQGQQQMKRPSQQQAPQAK